MDASPSSPTVVALGPWTNLEDAVIADPTVADRIAAIHAMGGAIDVPGNVIVDDVTADDGLEWNLAADPSAVSAIFETATPISLVPLDATDDVPIPPDLPERLTEHRPTAGADLVFELLARVPTRLTGEGQQLWDELAALTVGSPDLVTWEDALLLVDETGRVSRQDAGRPVLFATAADREAVETALVDALAVGADRVTPFELAGQLTVRWDGAACTFEMPGGLKPGLAGIDVREHDRRPGRRPDRRRARAAHLGRSGARACRGPCRDRRGARLDHRRRRRLRRARRGRIDHGFRVARGRDTTGRCA